MNYIIYQAYGNKAILEEAAFSILSLLRFAQAGSPPYRVVVYTDNQEFFEGIFTHTDFIGYRPLSPERLMDWRGKDSFVHRVKVKMLADFILAHKGNMLYLDTDTWFIRDPAPLFREISEGTRLMHVEEGRISGQSNPVFRKLNKFLKNGKREIPAETLMWNAGVLGFDSHDAALLSEVLRLTDLLYSQYPKHVMEQLAFSYVFQKAGRVVPAASYIGHYWDFKDFRSELKTFFENNRGRDLQQLIESAARLNPRDAKIKFLQNKPSGSCLARLFRKTIHRAS